MTDITGISANRYSWLYQLIFYLVAILLLVAYVVVYQLAPLPGAWNDIVTDGIVALAAAFAAVMATVIFFRYHPEDQPRVVWQNIMLACWLWFLGEVLWGIYNIIYGEVPAPGLADVGWVGGFVFFTLAFYRQYVLILPSKRARIGTIAILAWVVALFVPLVVLYWAHALTPETYINYYYPIADLAVGMAGLSLIYVFQGGALMRPWIGLVVFGISDLLYAWAQEAGVYSWSAANNSSLSLVIDATYLISYLVLAVGFAGHWMLLKYGLPAHPDNA